MRVREILAPLWDMGYEVDNDWVSKPGYPYHFVVNLGTGRTLYWDLNPGRDLDIPPVSMRFLDFAEILGLKIENEFYFDCRPTLIRELEEYILAYAEYEHPAFATLAAQSIVSSLIAPRCVSPYKAGKLNQFHLIIGESAKGKNDYANIIAEVLTDVLSSEEWEHGDPQSKQGLQYSIARNNYGILMLSEGANFLNAQKTDIHYGCAKILMNTWSSGGKLAKMAVKATEGTTPVVRYPVLSVLLEMVPADFEECLKNRDVAHGGLLPRCSWALASPRPVAKRLDTRPEMPQMIKARLRSLASALRSAVAQTEQQREEAERAATGNKKAKEVYFTDMEKVAFSWAVGGRRALTRVQDECDNLRDHYATTYRILSYIWGRTAERVLRMACATCAYEQAFQSQYEVTEKAIEEAFAYEKANIETFRDMFKEYENTHEHERIAERLMQKLALGPVNVREFRRSISSEKSTTLDVVLSQMVKDGVILDYKQRAARYVRLINDEGTQK